MPEVQDIKAVDEESTSLKKKEKKPRVWEIDFLRGLSIFMMFLDHFLYDVRTLPYFFSNYLKVDNKGFMGLVAFSNWFYDSGVRVPLHIIFVALFFLLSGISCSFSKHNFAHTIKIFIGHIIISGITIAVYFISKAAGNMVDIRILFGVLLQLALGVLVIALIRLIKKKWLRWSLYLGIGLTLITLGFVFEIFPAQKTVWVYGWPTWEEIPEIIWGSKGFGADYFSVLWIGFALIGAFIGELCYSERKSLLPKLDRGWHKPLTWLGKNTLWAYLIHQPIILGVLVGVCLLLGYRF